MDFRRSTEKPTVKAPQRGPDLRKAVGKTGEDLAAEYLTRLGYRILARNVRDRLGELDIVAQDGRVICFVEVRTRRAGAGHRQALESVDAAKQRRLSKLAVLFLKKKDWLDSAARFDVVSVALTGAADEVVLVKDAFPLTEDLY